MSICIRYVHKSIIKERFLGFVQVLKLDAQGLTHCIIEFLNAVGLDIEKCISQSYDGASVMSSSINGVQIKIRELSKNKCPYIHCYAHRLNLVLVDVAKSVEIVDDTDDYWKQFMHFNQVQFYAMAYFLKSKKIAKMY